MTSSGRRLRHGLRDFFLPARWYFAHRTARRIAKRRPLEELSARLEVLQAKISAFEIADAEANARARADAEANERALQAEEEIARERLFTLLDSDWYSAQHSILSTEAAEHFQSIGLPQGLAPCAALADGESPHLSDWGFLILKDHTRQFTLPRDGSPKLDNADLKLPVRTNETGKKFCVVTAIAGGIDQLRPLTGKAKQDADYFAFMDRDVGNHTGWTVLPFDIDVTGHRKRARFIKTHLHRYFSGYQWLIWIDANVVMHGPPGEVFADDIGSSADFMSFRHPDRRSVLQETRICIEWGRDDPATMIRQYKRYSETPGFRDNFLFESNVLLMRGGSELAKRACEMWWNEINNGSIRDQLSLPFVLQSIPELRWGYLSEPSTRNSGLFTLLNHDRPVPEGA